MKSGDLIYLIMTYNDDEIKIKVYETISGKYVDTAAAVTIAEDVAVPTLRIEVEAGKFNNFL